jgi:MFS family permease
LSSKPDYTSVSQELSTQTDTYAVFKNRDCLFYLLARFLTSFGTEMLTVAVGWEIYERTSSSLCLGYVGLSEFLPMIAMTIPAGHVADRYERRKVIQWMQAVSFLAVAGLFLITWQQKSVAWVYLCLAALGTATTFQWSASASFLPQLVTREEFPEAVNWSSSTFQFSAVTGPAAAGALIALFKSALPVLAINMAASVLAFALIAGIRPRQAPAALEKTTIHSLLAGFRFVFNTQLVLAAITLDLFAVLFGGATSLLPVFAKDILHCGPVGLGFLVAALPVGSLVCALYLAHRPPMMRAGRSLTLAVFGFGAATIVFGLSKNFWLSIAALIACGVGDHVSVVVRHTLVQMSTPDEMRGRVSSVNNLFIGTSNKLGGFESGYLSNLAGPVTSVVFGGIATIATLCVVVWKWPVLSKYGRLIPK